MTPLETFAQNSGELLALPPIYHEIKKEMDNPQATIQSISTVISKDEQLAACLVHIANSTLYGFSSRIEDIPEALQIIGVGQMKDLALMMSIIKTFKSIQIQTVSSTEFWSHSIACALASKEVAALVHGRDMERFLVGGLLHDIGRLVMYTKLAYEVVDIVKECRNKCEPDCVVENRILGFNHADLGGLVMEKWKIPITYVEMVSYHHQPDLAPSATIETAIVHIADFFACACEFGNSGEIYVAPLVTQVCDKLNIQEKAIPELLQRIYDSGCEIIPVLLSL